MDLLLDFARKNVAPVLDQGGRSFQLQGVPETSRAFFAASIARWLENGKASQPVLVVCPTQTEAEELASEALLFLEQERVAFFPGYAGIPYESAGVSAEICQERTRFLYRALNDGFQLGFVSAEALLRLLPAPDRMSAAGLELREKERPGPLREKLTAMGYEYGDLVDVPGEFCVKGSIVDIYPLNADAPVRIDFFDDEIDSIRVFDPMTQKSGDRITSCTILPAGEIVLAADETKKLASLLQSMPSKLERPEWVERVAESPHQITLLHAEGLQDLFPLVIPTAGLLEYFNTNPLIVLFEPAAVDEGMLRVRREYAALYDREKSVRACILPEKLLSPDNVPPWGDLQVLTAPLFQGAVETEEGVTAIAPLAGVRRIEGFGGRMRAVREAIGRVIAEGGSVVITSPYQAQLNRIATLFKDKPTVKSADATEAEKQTDTGPSLKIEQTIAEPPLVFYGQPGLTLIRSSQRKGFALPDFNFFLWSDNDVFGRSYRRQSRFKKAQSSPLESFLDLKEGDHVVHVNHGIGRFVKLERVKAAGRERDFLVIEYADQDKLFVPLDQISMVQKYIAPVEKPRLDSLGRASFKKVREKVAEKIEEFAEELLATYATRASQKGFSFPPDTAWQEEFEGEFPFEETPDQITAIDAVKRDMENIRPMDRLICGDVGYGKTEVAIRAVFKSVMAGRQAAVIAPTTILALQHFKTISERFKNYPISVDWISRFRTRGEINDVKERLRKADLDVVVGTHALLSGDVAIKNLGVLIIDEEQRFGVVHKEAIKKMRKMVDVLTLSATPIPRTLHMSLVGIRDLSIIQTPPRDRLPVETFVTEDSESLLKEALRRELERDGQVFFLHNRIESIEQAAKRVTDMFPDVRTAVLHGQMAEEEIEDVLLDFMERKYDVLVTTAIIENGIDMPNVNTLIVDRADTFGLSQLYQIRGRVGRSNRQAYAYLFYPKGRLLTEEAQKRLHAIMEYQELGSGFKVAMRDLEIRGAGNIFGREQSGHIIDVGYELYIKMLEEAVRRLQGAVHQIEVRTSINLNADFFLPADYIVDTRQRIELYKRFEGAQELSEVEELAREMQERFGEPPDSARSFVRIEMIRTLASRAGFESVYEEDSGKVHMKAGETFRVSRDHLIQVLRTDDRLKVLPGSADTLFVEPKGPSDSRMDEILSILKELVVS